MPRFQSGPVTLKTTDLNAGAAINIGAVTSMNIRTNVQTISDESGDIYDESIFLTSEIIDADFKTKAIDAILTYIGLGGYCLLTDGTHPGLDLFGRVLSDCKSPPAATDNLRYRFGLGLLCLGELTCNRGQDAQISVMCKPITDGTNAPMAWASSSISLPATSTLSKNQFTIGACKAGAVAINDFDSFSMQFGVQTTQITPMAGSVWPDSVGVRKVLTVAQWTGFDPRILNDSTGVPLLGKQATHANSLIQFKKRLGYSSFVADGTSAHTALTINGGAHVTDVFTAGGNAEARQTIRVVGVHDGTNVPVLATIGTTYNPSP